MIKWYSLYAYVHGYNVGPWYGAIPDATHKFVNTKYFKKKKCNVKLAYKMQYWRRKSIEAMVYESRQQQWNGIHDLWYLHLQFRPMYRVDTTWHWCEYGILVNHSYFSLGVVVHFFIDVLLSFNFCSNNYIREKEVLAEKWIFCKNIKGS